MEAHNQNTATVAVPVSEKERLISLDAIRGMALLGILIMNIQVFAMALSAYENPTVYGDLTGINYWVRWISEVVADQKFMTIFSMLFGASLMLMAEKAQAKGVNPRGLHYRRMLWLFLFGLAHAVLIWGGDILLFYAVCGAIAFWFHRWKARNLIITGFIFLGIFVGLLLLLGLSADYIPAEDMDEMMKLWSPTEQRIAEINAGNRSGWVTQSENRISMYMSMLVNLPFLIFRLVGAMLIGMGLYKAALLDASRSKGFYAINALIGIVVGFSLSIFTLGEIEASNYDMMFSTSTAGVYTTFASFITAWGYICLLQLIVKNASDNGSQSIAVKFLAPIGQMALSNYIFQSLVCGTIFFGWGFGLFGSVERIGQVGVVLGVWVAQVALSYWWIQRYRFGPLEWLWRSLTYWKKQPFVRVR